MVKFKFLADECTFAQTVRLMRDLGFHVERIQDLGMIGAGDSAIFAKAQEIRAVLVTNNKGFGDIRAYPPSSHHGVIVLKIPPNPQAVRRVHQVLSRLLGNEACFEGILFIVDAKKYRKRGVKAEETRGRDEGSRGAGETRSGGEP